MKKYIFFILLGISIIHINLNAQLYVGAKVGVAPSILKMENLPNHTTSPIFLNPLAGVIVEIPIIFGFSIQPEFQYVSRGTKLKAILDGSKANVVLGEGNYFSDYSLDTDYNQNNRDNGFADQYETFKLPDLYENDLIKLNYVETHLLFKYEFIGGGSGWFIQAGPYYSVGISSKGTGTLIDKDGSKTSSDFNLISNDASITEDYTDLVNSYPNNMQLSFSPFKGDRTSYNFKKGDFGLAVGGGMYKELNNGRLYFDGRILWGTKDFNRREGTSATIKSRSFQLAVTYLFALG